jgi:membrane dipeptidase (peptidase family M19)
MQVEQTGQPFSSEPCTGADEADGQCNAKGLSDLGRYLVQRLIAKHMLIEVDHLSQKARASVLAIAEANHYPVVSSHTGTGGEWTPAQLRRLYAMGGLASATLGTALELSQKIIRLNSYGSSARFLCVGIGSDTGGFNALPDRRPDAASHRLRYPFKSYDGKVEFGRQRSGRRAFDLNTDGVAHYGLLADLLGDMKRQRTTRAALPPLFRSAEAYLRMWGRAVAHG